MAWPNRSQTTEAYTSTKNELSDKNTWTKRLGIHPKVKMMQAHKVQRLTSLSFARTIRAVTNPTSSSLRPFGRLRSTAAHDTISCPLTTFWKNSDSYLTVSINMWKTIAYDQWRYQMRTSTWWETNHNGFALKSDDQRVL